MNGVQNEVATILRCIFDLQNAHPGFDEDYYKRWEAEALKVLDANFICCYHKDKDGSMQRPGPTTTVTAFVHTLGRILAGIHDVTPRKDGKKTGVNAFTDDLKAVLKALNVYEHVCSWFKSRSHGWDKDNSELVHELHNTRVHEPDDEVDPNLAAMFAGRLLEDSMEVPGETSLPQVSSPNSSDSV